MLSSVSGEPENSSERSAPEHEPPFNFCFLLSEFIHLLNKNTDPTRVCVFVCPFPPVHRETRSEVLISKTFIPLFIFIFTGSDLSNAVR